MIINTLIKDNQFTTLQKKDPFPQININTMLKSYYALGNCLFYTNIPTYVILSMDPSFPHFLMNRRNKSGLDKKQL